MARIVASGCGRFTDDAKAAIKDEDRTLPAGCIEELAELRIQNHCFIGDPGRRTGVDNWNGKY